MKRSIITFNCIVKDLQLKQTTLPLTVLIRTTRQDLDGLELQETTCGSLSVIWFQRTSVL